MSLEPSWVQCGGVDRHAFPHPIICDRGLMATGCAICRLLEEREALRTTIRCAAEYLEEGKVVLAHRLLDGVSVPATSEDPKR